ncbi:arginine--tRNA ligase [Candidatus Saccharibacteria bacterium]|nr:arginine--tRNA ligase [Candidatus Saccharibacteria bacterium]MCL1963081.1 arginine--tRNA ligase [Candidatus Saccharibacteria bacterium]
MEIFSSVIADVIKQLFQIDVVAEISRPEAKFGDLATNVAMKLAGQLGKNPREIAEQIAGELRNNPDFAGVSIAGPGFINLKVSEKFLAREFDKMLKNPAEYGASQMYAGKTVVTEFSDPNPFKELHVGHLYTTIIGESISRLIEAAGGAAHRVNFGGDVGLHVGKAMWGIVRTLDGENPEKLNEISESDRPSFLSKCYVMGAGAYENDESAKTEIIEYNKAVYDITATNNHESPLAQIYWTGRGWSYDYFKNFYREIGVEFEKFYPESETAKIGMATVREQQKHGVYEESAGAIVFNGEKYGLHTRVFINGQGLPTYETKDLGVAMSKWRDYHPDQSIIITGNDIVEYMKVLMKSIEQFAPEISSTTLHITHNNVKLAGSGKMSSRLGKVLRAVDVIDMVKSTYQETQGSIDMIQVFGAIKYTFLKNRIGGGDIIFDMQESVSTTGNSGPYLQYAATRANSILRNLGANFADEFTAVDFDEFERALLVKIMEFSDIVAVATKDLAPHVICTYLYELAQTFNRFYENSRVAGDPRENLRARLVKIYAEILRRGLDILSMQVPEKM